MRSMISVYEKHAPKPRKLWGGYRAEVIVQRQFEPVGITFVVTLRDKDALPAVMSLIRGREELLEAWRREVDEAHVLRLFAQIYEKNDELRDHGARVRRKILWF